MSRRKPDFEIHVRAYRDSDSEKVPELFRNAIIIGGRYTSVLSSHPIIVNG